MEPSEVVHSKPDDPYQVASRWDDEGFHIMVTADVLYDQEEPDEVREKVQDICQLLVENIFRGTEFKQFKRHVVNPIIRKEQPDGPSQ